jgi:hypothetical protein
MPDRALQRTAAGRRSCNRRVSWLASWGWIVRPLCIALYVGNVVDTFDITGRGLVVATNLTYEQLPQCFTLKIGDSVEFRHSGETVLTTTVAGIEHCDPRTPKSVFAFLLPRSVQKVDVPAGSEVWRVG